MNTYICVCLGSAYLALAITPAIIWLARKIKALDHPGLRKVHLRPVPHIGGVVIILSTIGLVLPVLFLQNIIGEAFREIRLQVAVLLSAATLVFLVGLIDDLKGLRARVKLLVELAGGIAVCAVGIRISSVAVADWLTINFGWFSWPLTILWIVGITNAVNLSDGLDGLAAGISAIACGVIAMLAIWSGQVVMAVLMLALLGSLAGFLFFNFSPAKVFLGDCGSLFLGFTIATSSVMCSTKSSALVGLALPFLALGIPIFDTLFSMLRRFLDRRSLFAPDCSHFHHRLLALGLKQQHAVIVAYAVTSLAAGLGLLMMLTRHTGSMILFLFTLLLLALAFRIVGAVRLQDIIVGLQKKWTLARQQNEQARRFEQAQLHFRQAHNCDDWWTAVCGAAQQMDFAWLSLKTTEKDGTINTSVWRGPDFTSDLSKVIVMNVPVGNGQTDPSLELEIAVPVNGALESASHQAMLFSRLIDEYNLMRLNSKVGFNAFLSV